jgi:hypothetical protein
MKVVRATSAWDAKKKAARKNGAVVTTRLPAWVEDHGGRLCLIPERAAVVKRMFALAARGYGNGSITKVLVREGVPAFTAHQTDANGRRKALPGQVYGAGRWIRAYVGLILKDRRATGEYQPRKQNGEPDGDPIPGYFPAVVTEAEWFAARAGAASRTLKAGRIGNEVANVFAGLLHNARDGQTYYAATRMHKDRKDPTQVQRHRVLVNSGSDQGRARCYSFAYGHFESAILSLLREIKPVSVFDDADDDQAAAAEAELQWVREKKAALSAELLNGDVSAIADALRRLEARERELSGKLSKAQEQAAVPLAATWEEARSLVTALADASDPEDARLRLRAALRRTIDAVWLLVVPRAQDRLCAAQVRFVGDKAEHRDYLILSRPTKDNGKARQEGGYWARSLADVVELGSLDLRDRDQAAQLEAALAVVDVEELLKRMVDA